MSVTNEEASNILRLVATEALEGVSRFVESENNRDKFKQAYEMAIKELERKKGKWVVQPSAGEDRPFIWWKCSECGHVIFSETERDRKEFHAFCGRCGADMRGETDE